jgi:hypothetical protein
MQADIKKQFKTLNLIYVAILGSLSVAAIFSVVYIFKSGALPVFDAENQAVIKSIVIIAILVGIPISHIFFYKKIKHIDSSLAIIVKMKLYQTAFMIRIAMLEAIGLLAMIGYLVTADKSFLYMFGVVFVLFLIHAPTRSKLINDLNLTEEEEGEFFK